ncbi:MAG: hypothetical protein E7131_06385 [Rikenellaceae bacterium]|nr:hypothetical protein [Rikenellaceae bacterium]
MKQSNNAIHRATLRRIQPQLPAGFGQRTMLRIRRRERVREWMQYALCGTIFIALFAQCLQWVFTRLSISFDFDIPMPKFDFAAIDFVLVKNIAIISVPLILMLLLDSYLRLKMQAHFLFKEDKK